MPGVHHPFAVVEVEYPVCGVGVAAFEVERRILDPRDAIHVRQLNRVEVALDFGVVEDKFTPGRPRVDGARRRRTELGEVDRRILEAYLHAGVDVAVRGIVHPVPEEQLRIRRRFRTDLERGADKVERRVRSVDAHPLGDG